MNIQGLPPLDWVMRRISEAQDINKPAKYNPTSAKILALTLPIFEAYTASHQLIPQL